MAFVVGPVGDRFSRKWIITLSLLSWSLMTFMVGFVGDWRLFGFVIPAFFVVIRRCWQTREDLFGQVRCTCPAGGLSCAAKLLRVLPKVPCFTI